jgi:hypothetical protein
MRLAVSCNMRFQEREQRVSLCPAHLFAEAAQLLGILLFEGQQSLGTTHSSHSV